MRQEYEDGLGDWDEDEAEDGDNVLGRGWTIGHGDDDKEEVGAHEDGDNKIV